MRTERDWREKKGRDWEFVQLLGFYKITENVLICHLTELLVMSQQPLFRDPWAKREAWRKHPVFSKVAMFKNLFPGFGIAVVAFSAFERDGFYFL
ncbi:nadh-ubiquinone oxidoreductase b12 [Pyrrhoderma noxium]|uniref:Nadh-ubiquinone oxidoreductase b12 n=1 Tax=Pyrrhoderma noxium TaxID=2282107 RepID=A0A286UHP3_9AGAM|nr:nadh-ubiquinone oxidoreductase b12 [Pyrrhoderma noxium]